MNISPGVGKDKSSIKPLVELRQAWQQFEEIKDMLGTLEAMLFAPVEGKPIARETPNALLDLATDITNSANHIYAWMKDLIGRLGESERTPANE